jgi:hypothetical protein
MKSRIIDSAYGWELATIVRGSGPKPALTCKPFTADNLCDAKPKFAVQFKGSFRWYVCDHHAEPIRQDMREAHDMVKTMAKQGIKELVYA